MADLITIDKIQYFIKTGTSEFTKITEANAFDPKVDISTYDPKYKDRVNQPSYVTGKKTTIEIDLDIIDPGALQSWLMGNEDTVNVPTEIVRVLTFRPAYPAWVLSTVKALGAHIIAAGKLYECTTAGTTGTTEPASWTTTTVTDGTVTWTYVGSATGYPIGTSGYAAKKAAFSLTQNPLDGSAGEAVKATGTLSMTSDGWMAGTFDTSTKTFTPAG